MPQTAQARGQAARRVENAAHPRPVWWSLAAVLLLTSLWRLPSMWDPPWVNDEGTYFAVAQALARGTRLYVGVWENKPPAVYMVYLAVYHWFGASLVSVRLLAWLAVLLLVGAIWLLTRLLGASPLATQASLLAGLLVGVPFLEGTTANAEVFLAPLTAWAALLTLGPRRAVLGGILAGMAALFKAVAAFDAAALVLWLLFNGRRRDGAGFVAGGLVVAALTLGLAGVAGILPAMLRDAFLYDTGYVGHANGGGLPWFLALKLLVLAGLTVRLRHSPFPYLWLAYAAAGALFSGRFFGHYALQAVAPLCLTLALLLDRRGRALRRPLITLPALFAAAGLLAAVIGWSLAMAGQDSIFARRLQYYANWARLMLRQESYGAYRDQIDDHVNRNIALAAVVRHQPPGPLLVWGNVPWVYVLSARRPATAYTSSLRSPEVPGETAALRRAVEGRMARLLVVIRPPTPPLGGATSAIRACYRPIATVDGARAYASARSCTRSVSRTARASSGTR